ncbi:MAG TPA: carboxypeptidase regulatory-like domain-containing protein [Gemmatimonadaceae bacterium]|jgi:hypothetical protein
MIGRVLLTAAATVAVVSGRPRTGVAQSPATPPLDHSSSVTGRVLDGNVPIVNADVVLSSMMEDTTSVNTHTDSSGAFSLRRIAPGVYRLSARRVGYEQSAVAIIVSANANIIDPIQLHRSAQLLDRVVVTDPTGKPARYGSLSRMDEFYERRAHGVGHFFTRESLDSAGPSSLDAILRRVAGVHVSTGPNFLNVQFAQCRAALLPQQRGGSGATHFAASTDTAGSFALVVDGVMISHAEIPEMLASFNLSQIEAIEVYRGPSELPMEVMGNACAAIYIWSRVIGTAAPRPPKTDHARIHEPRLLAFHRRRP